VSKGKVPYIVAIDTQTLVWGVRREGGSVDQLQRAKWLFELFTADNAQVLLPAIVISEYLIPAEKKSHPAIIDAINKRFLIKPFDIECASLAAELFKIGKPMRPSGVPMGREVLRSDTLIIATAKVHKAKVFYTNDNDCRALASRVMDARPLPNNSHELFPPSLKIST
jgi:predicted nucleic acid-binding protein